MSDIYDYLYWRGDLGFDEVGIREVDYLAFCCLSYIPYDGFVKDSLSTKVNLGEVLEKVNASVLDPADSRKYQNKGDDILVESMLTSPRFSDLKICGYINKIDKAAEEQFCAMTFVLPKNRVMIAFRGTDSTLVGWKEDFNMGFMEELPSQCDAVAYVNKVAEVFPKADIYVCGHSKGGNLAMYSASFCSREVQDRIIAVRNMDGPGFNDDVLAREGSQRIMGRVETYVPQSSVVGMLLSHAEPYHVVHSVNFSLMQHYMNSWGIERDKLEADEGLTDSSQLIDATLKDWLNEMTPETRGKLIDCFYSVIAASDAKTLADLATGKSTLAVLKARSKVDDETKVLFKEAYKIFKKSLKKSLPVVKLLKQETKEA